MDATNLTSSGASPGLVGILRCASRSFGRDFLEHGLEEAGTRRA